MSDLTKAIQDLREAIRNEGSHPAWHRGIMERHRREWPTLWKAIDALLAAELGVARDD